MECTITNKPKPVVFEFNESWSPLGVQRLFDLLDGGFWENQALFRVVKSFLVQFGVPGTPQLKEFCSKHAPALADEPKPKFFEDEYHHIFQKGWVSYAGAGPNSRNHHFFISFASTTGLGKADHETPIGRVISGWESVEAIEDSYGDMKPFNEKGVDFGRIFSEGYDYLKREFPKLDYMQGCKETFPTKAKEEKKAPWKNFDEKVKAQTADDRGLPWLWIILFVASVGLCINYFTSLGRNPMPTGRGRRVIV